MLLLSDAPDDARLAKSLTLAAMSLGFGVVQLDVTIVNTSLSSIGATLGGGVSELQWVVSAYAIAFAALILAAGALGDRLGARRMFMWGFGVFTAASLAWSPFKTGLAFLPMMGAVLPMNLLAAGASERFGAPAVITAGAATSGLGCIALLGIPRGASYWALGGQLLAIGAGLGLLVPPLTSTLLGSVEKARSGVAAGVLNATRQTGSVIGVALFGSLVAKEGAFISGAREALIISIILLFGAALMIVIVGRQKDGPSTN